MPRSGKSKRVQDDAPGTVSVLEPEGDIRVMSTAVDEEDLDNTDPGFTFESFSAPEDFTPDRKTPGRVRRPSYFDGILRDPEVFNGGWQFIPVTSRDHLEAAKRELGRAKLWLNKEGLAQNPPLPEIGLEFDEREDALYYRSRTAQKRERKSTNGTIDVADDGEDDEFGE